MTVRAVTFDAGQTLIQLDTAMLAARLAERDVTVTAAGLVAAQAAAWQHYERIVKAGGHADRRRRCARRETWRP